MKKGICCAGNMIVDITYPIEAWPNKSELTHITEGITFSSGGCVCNTLMDLSRLDPSLPLFASGCAGHDTEGDFLMEQMSRYPNVDTSMIRRSGRTSFTMVMSDNRTKERTFFVHDGANAYYGENDIDWNALDVDIFHIGYILLLPHLDQRDPEYGTRMARLLHRVQQKGIRTSVDVVSETGSRYQELVIPALKYADYCIINELEAQYTTGVLLRDDQGVLHKENLPVALGRMRKYGVSAWAVIHCPELGCGMDEAGNYVELPCLKLPPGYIKGTVGAGDAFCAGVLYGAEMDWSLEQALQLGICTAAASLGTAGASGGVGHVESMLSMWHTYQE